MSEPYRFVENLAQAIDIPVNGILSKTILSDELVKVVLFGMDEGQELSEHTASMPAILQIIQGEAELRLAGDEHVVGAGSWTHMSAALPHSVLAKTPLVMQLILLKHG